eukprot:CAMPEP_0183379052 /NCGR_PEP_ID=MMETSP0164_2-20130417/125230_1 /TAXON_ID=221442 /ORGANISM="Coccolithus pelagicus ssp braarudi, Strain PLY182g" /LENGTH=376 /DNA_ID=CAMNT_0025556629 /DNA_START=484 /DNA_END=1611 /DNA_ORIENTATION=+
MAQVTVNGKRMPYKLPVECEMTRSCQRRAINRWLRKKKLDRGPADDTDDDDTDDDSDASDGGRDRSRSRGRTSHSDRCDPMVDDDVLGFQHELVSESSAFVEEVTAEFEPPSHKGGTENRSSCRRAKTGANVGGVAGRAVVGSEELLWSELFASEPTMRSNYERDRVGSRHGRVREVSYSESRENEVQLSAALERERDARERLEQRHAEMQRIARELQLTVDAQAGGLNQQMAATLQRALLDLLAQEDEPEGDQPSEGQTAAEDCEMGASSEQEASIRFEAGAHVGGVAGRAVVGSEELLWSELFASEPTMRMELVSVTQISTKRMRLSPFSSVERCVIKASLPASFDFASDAEGRALCEQFRVAVEDAVTAAAAA